MTEIPQERGEPSDVAGAPLPSVTMPLRRKLIVGAAPFILTVGSRSALAQTAHVCTPSGFKSLNPSHVTNDPHLNCGVTPGAWNQAIGNPQGIWSYVTALTPDTPFTQALGPNPNPIGPQMGQNPKWRVYRNGNITSLTPTLGDAVNNLVSIQYEPSSSNHLAQFDVSFAARLAASLLNASAFNGVNISGHYDGMNDITVSYVQIQAGNIWKYLTNNDKTGAEQIVKATVDNVYKVA